VLTVRDHNVEDYAALRDMDATDVAVLDGADRACLDELGQGKTERFGVRLIRDPLGLLDNEVLLETCDIAHRAVRCSGAERHSVHAENSVETTWQWKPSLSRSGRRPIQKCMQMCSQDPYGNHYISGHVYTGIR